MSYILVEEEKPEKVDMTTPLKALTLDYDLLWGERGGGEKEREREREREGWSAFGSTNISVCNYILAISPKLLN